MLVDGVLILYTSTPASALLLSRVAQLKAAGVEVFLMPITKLEQKKKPRITPGLRASLSALQPN